MPMRVGVCVHPQISILPITCISLNHTLNLLRRNHLHSHMAVKEDAGNKGDKTAGMSDSLRMEINLPLSGDSETYGGFLNADSFKEDFSSQLDNKPEINPDIRTEIMPNPANDAVNGSSTEIDQTQKYIEHSDIVSQLSETLVDLYHIGGHTAKIRLYPEELGNLHIDINVVDDSIKAVVTVEGIGVKDMLEKNLDILIDGLKDSGLNIDQFTVKYRLLLTEIICGRMVRHEPEDV